MKIAIVTGGSAGIGKAAAHMLAENGYKVYELSRSGVSDGKIKHITADVTDETAVREAFKEVVSNEGRIDLLVNNAGFGISGAAEFTCTEDAKRQFDVNFFGTFICCREAIPYLRKSRGRIINVSSVAANFPIPFQSFYSASKSAVSSFTLCLANELRPFGIKVCTVSPGDVRTNFTAAREKNSQGSEFYGDKINSAVKTMERDETNGMPPEAAAKVILRAALKKRPAPIYTVGGKYKLFNLLGAVLPARVKNFIVGKMY